MVQFWSRCSIAGNIKGGFFMKVISIVDDDYGIMFNNRRVSKDSVLNEHIIKMLDGRKLLNIIP